MEIPAVISFADAERIRDGMDGAKLALSVIRKWNLTDPDGSDADITEESVRNLDLRVVNRIIDEVTSLMTLPKVPKPESGGQSGEAAGAMS